MVSSPSWETDDNLYEDYYKYRIYDIINYCETKGNFTNYKQYLEKELEEEKKLNPELNQIQFNTIHKMKGFDTLKNLCN